MIKQHRKKIFSFVFLFCFVAVILASTFGCKDGFTEDEVNAGYEEFTITEPQDFVTIGFGAQMDTDMFMSWNRMTEAEEKMIADRVEAMNLQYTRVKMFPEWFERGNDNDDPRVFDANSKDVDFDSAEMKALYKVLDICQKNNIKVDLSWYGCNTNFASMDEQYTGSWLGYPYTPTIGWASGPRVKNPDGTPFPGYQEYAENISTGLKYLIEERGYTCIYALTVIAEMFCDETGKVSYEEYAKCCKIVNQKLIDDGIRDKVIHIGASNTAHYNLNYFEDEMELFQDEFEYFGAGNYIWDNTIDFNIPREYFAEMREIAKKYDKEVVISELGTGGHFTNPTTRSDIADYEAGLFLPRLMIAATENGVSGLNHYILCDTFFTNAYVHTMGLWLYRDNQWKAHPSYYFWGMLCKYSDHGSQVYKIPKEDSNIMMIGFKTPEGKWSYMIVNNHKSTKKVAIVNRRNDRPNQMSVYKVTERTLPEDRDAVLPSAYTTVNAKGGVVHVSLPPKSFTVISNK